MPFSHPHLAAEHSIDVHKVAECKHSTHRPPDEANLQAMNAGTGVFDGQVVLMIASRKHNRIERKCGAYQHAGDIQTRSHECGLLFALGSSPEHDSQTRK